MADENKPLTKIGGTTDDGETGTDYYELAKIEIGKRDTHYYYDLAKKADAEAYIKEYLPATRCGHSYDCCANRYEHAAQIVGDDITRENWIIRQGWYINI
jgi:hypothetical protein